MAVALVMIVPLGFDSPYSQTTKGIHSAFAGVRCSPWVGLAAEVGKRKILSWRTLDSLPRLDADSEELLTIGVFWAESE